MILGSMECCKTRNDYICANASIKNIKSLKYYAEKLSEATAKEIQSQNWDGSRHLAMEVIDVEYFPNSIDTSNNEEKSELNSYISDDNE